MSDPTFTTHGDDALEARLTAWVLGEASAFEVAELERLCDQQPELLVFKRRIEALHGLLREAETAGPDAEWKLRPAKRLPIESILLGEDERQMEARVRRSSWRSFVAIAACVVLTLAVAALLGDRIILKHEAVSAIMEETSAFTVSEESWSDEAVAYAPLEAKKQQQNMVPFSQIADAQSLPQELIEGTPKPVQVPGLVDPSARIAAQLSRKEGEVKQDAFAEQEMVRREKPIAEPNAALVDAFSANAPPNAPAKDEIQNRLGESSLQGFVSPDTSGITQDSEHRDWRRNASGGDELDSLAMVPMDAPLVLHNGLQVGNRFAGASGNEAKNWNFSSGAAADDAIDQGAPMARARQEPGSDSAYGLDESSDVAGTAGGELQEQAQQSGRLGLAVSEPERNADGNRRLSAPTSRDEATKRGLDAQDYFDARREFQTEQERLQSMKLTQALAKTSEKPELMPSKKVAEFNKVVREQEDKVEERRKVLSTIVRTKGIIYKGDEGKFSEKREEAIKRGLDAQDYVAAKRAYESDVELLKAMKEKQRQLQLKLGEKPADDPVKANQPVVAAPKRPIVVEGEIIAAAEPYSTFSLNINDASFRVAQAALAKGEQPDPNGIHVEQFYNAVDYGDPSPGVDEPVAGHVEQVAHPVIPGRNLVRVAIKTASAGRLPQQPLCLTLLIDTSGSMAREDRRAAMEDALAGLSKLLQPQDVVNVIGFARTPHLLAEGLQGSQTGKLADLVNLDASEGGTNLEEALKLAGQLAGRSKSAAAQNRIVLFTDGAANLGDAEPESLTNKIKQLRQQGIALDIAGIAADGLNDELLGELARNGNGRYYVVGKGEQMQLAKQLAGAFRPAAENVKVQVHFNPQRVSRYKLIGFEKDRLNKEDFRNDQVDAAEMAAEEAGVAIYQVEVLPEGDGELGEVSVRFRDTSSSEMVERSWTLTHDPSAPSIGEATPSMQLAMLAMFIGQKLKGGPLADAINFSDFGPVQAEVRQHFGSAGRVGELLQMIDALK